jgi:hypothetical protein
MLSETPTIVWEDIDDVESVVEKIAEAIPK